MVFNQMSVADTYGRGVQDKQRETRNALLEDATRQSLEANKHQFDQAKQLDNTRWLAANTQRILEGYQNDPQGTMTQVLPKVIQEAGQRQILDPSKLEDYTVLDPNEVMSIIQGLNEDAQTNLKTFGPQMESISAEEVPQFQRNSETGQVTSPLTATNQAKPPASISEYNLYAKQQAEAGQEPISFFDFKKQIAEQSSAGRAAGTNSVVPVGTQVEAENKRPRMTAARSNLENIREASKAIEKNRLLKGGPLQGEALALTEEGQFFTQYRDNLMTHIQALTRIPGVGAQSDWEGRLNQAVLPDLNQHPKVRDAAIEALEELVNDLEQAANNVQSGNLGGGSSEKPDPFEAEWASAPSGTVLRAPDGTLRRKP